MLYGAVETGGTKVLCGIGTSPNDLRDVIRIPTTFPDDTLAAVAQYFHDHRVDRLGIAAFGPLDLTPGRDYGALTHTPKPGWSGVNIVRYLHEALSLPVTIDTDVNAAALAEQIWGAAQGSRVCLYVTVGTGIGGGIAIDGRPYHGFGHPEMGHIPIPRAVGDIFEGTCPYHQDCLEGLASGHSLDARFGPHWPQFAPDHPVWQWEAEYIGRALVTWIYVLMPDQVILGGGVMQNTALWPQILRQVELGIKGYGISRDLASLIRPPKFASQAGLVGALHLAHQSQSGNESGPT